MTSTPPSPRPRPGTASVSSTTTYETCPRRYRFAHVDRVPVDRAEAPVAWRMGTVVHAGLAAGFRHHQAVGTSTDLDHAVPAARAAVRTAWVDESMPDDPAELARAEATVADALRSTRLAPTDILGVEHRFRAETDDGVTVTGISDLVVRTGPDAIEIRDHKVTRSVRTAEQLHGDLQLGIYGWLARRTWPGTDHVVVAHHYPLTRELVRVDLDDAWVDAAVTRLRTVAHRAAADTEFTPAPGDHCRWCVYRAHCDAATT